MKTKIRPIAYKMRHLTTGLTALALAAGIAQAGTLWQVADGDWATAANWSGGLPTSTVDAIIDNNGTCRITANAASKDVGIGYAGNDLVDASTFNTSGTVIQTAGTWTVSGDRFYLGRNANVGVYLLQGGAITRAAGKGELRIGYDNSGAAGPSYVIQSGTANAQYKSMQLANFGTGAQAYYEMNSTGLMNLGQYSLSMARGGGSGTQQKATFTQTAGTVQLPGGTSDGGLRLGEGTGGGGHAKVNLDGGTFYITASSNPAAAFVFSQPSGNAGVYVNTTNGQMRLEGTWTLGTLTGIPNQDFRSHMLPVDAENTFFLPNGSNTDITAYNLLHRNVSGNNDYTTAIALTENKYIYSDSGTLTLTSGSDITGAFNLKLGGTGDIIVSDPVAIDGVLAKDGAGTLTLNAINTHTGATGVAGGTLVLGHATNTLPDTGPVTVSGGTLDLGAFSDTVGAVTLAGGAITGTGVLTGTSYAVQTGTISAKLGGSGNLTKTGTGSVILSGDNSAATGTMLVSAGALQFDSTASLFFGATRNITVTSPGAVVFGPSFGTISTTLKGRILNTSSGVIAADNHDSEDLDFSNSGTGANFTAASLGAVGNVTYTGTLTPNGTAYRLGGGGGTLTMANTNALTDARTLTVNGNVTLAGANNYSNGTTLSSGTLTLGDAGSLGSGALTINGGTMASTGTVVTTNVVNGNGNFSIGGTGALTLGAITLNANRIITNNNTTGTTTFGAFSGATRTLTFTGSGATEVNGIIATTTGTLTMTGSGTLILSGANEYSGTTTVSAGTLVLLGSNSSAGATNLTAGTLQLGGTSNGGLASGALNFGNGTLDAAVIQAVNSDQVISNNVNLNQNNGTVSGSQNLQITGTFTNNNGNRILTNNLDTGKTLTLGDVLLSHNNAARTLTITGTGDTTINGTVANFDSLAGSLTKDGGGTLTLTNANNTYTGTTTVSGGTLLVNGNKTGTGVVNVNNTATLGGTGSIADNVTYATGAKALFTVTPSGGANTTPLTITGVMTYNSTEIHLNLPAGLQNGTYDLATSSATPVLNGTFPTPVVDSGSYQGGSSGEITLDTVNMKLVLTVTGGATSPYDAWAGAGVAFDADANGDGVDNGMAWMLGALTPADNANGLLPVVANDGTFLTLDFERVNPYAPAKLYVQYSNDLVVWTELEIPATSNPDVGGTGVQVEASAATPKETVTVKIPTSYQSASGALFARLRAADN